MHLLTEWETKGERKESMLLARQTSKNHSHKLLLQTGCHSGAKDMAVLMYSKLGLSLPSQSKQSTQAQKHVCYREIAILMMCAVTATR